MPSHKVKFLCSAITALGIVSSSLPVFSAETTWRNPVSTETLTTSGSKEFQVISRGGQAGPYQAFPDATRLANGDIMAVFYTGYTHVSLPKAGWENGGRICSVRSTDEGRTWSTPKILFDDERDNRDPHIAQLSDGTMIVSFFSLMPKPDAKSASDRASSGTEIITSHDGGATWSQPRVLAKGWYVSAPVRQLKDGTCLLGIYKMPTDTEEGLGGVLISKDSGKTWSEPKVMGKGQNLPIDAETDVIELQDGRIFAALRSSDKNMYFAYSSDQGETWQPAKDSGFRGHAPHLLRLTSGDIIMSHRRPDTSMHISRDDTRTWQGPYLIDNVFGAYTSCVELKDGTVLVVYYTEGKTSHVRVRRFSLTDHGPVFLPVQNW